MTGLSCKQNSKEHQSGALFRHIILSVHVPSRLFYFASSSAQAVQLIRKVRFNITSRSRFKRHWHEKTGKYVCHQALAVFRFSSAEEPMLDLLENWTIPNDDMPGLGSLTPSFMANGAEALNCHMEIQPKLFDANPGLSFEHPNRKREPKPQEQDTPTTSTCSDEVPTRGEVR